MISVANVARIPRSKKKKKKKKRGLKLSGWFPGNMETYARTRLKIYQWRPGTFKDIMWRVVKVLTANATAIFAQRAQKQWHGRRQTQPSKLTVRGNTPSAVSSHSTSEVWPFVVSLFLSFSTLHITYGEFTKRRRDVQHPRPGCAPVHHREEDSRRILRTGFGSDALRWD